MIRRSSERRDMWGDNLLHNVDSGNAIHNQTPNVTMLMIRNYDELANVHKILNKDKKREENNAQGDRLGNYADGGCAVATVSPVAELWVTSMKPDFFGLES